MEALRSLCHKTDEIIEGPSKLSSLQFVVVTTFLTGVPFGGEYLIEAIGTGYSLLLMIVCVLTIAYPIALMSAELSSIIPSNHGMVAWVYRGFHTINPTVGDFVGFVSTLNACVAYHLINAEYAIAFAGYMETLTGQLSYGSKYALMLFFILCGVGMGISNVSTVGTTTNTIIFICMIPVLAGIFVVLGTSNFNGENAFIGVCDDADWAGALATILWFSMGYETMGSIVGEMNFDVEHLGVYFATAATGSTLLVALPIITVSAFSPNCESWYIGYFAVGYGELWTPFYYMLLVGCVFCYFASYFFVVLLRSRILWAMSEPYILVDKENGSMMMPSEYDDDDGYEMVDLNDENKYTKIQIGILPEMVGKIWETTGAPWVGVILQGLITAVICLYEEYYALAEFNVYPYWFCIIAMAASFLILRFNEPDLPRKYEIPGGMIGACAVTIMLCGAMSCIAIYLMIYLYDMFVIAVAMNILFAFYWLFLRYFWEKIKNKIFPNQEKQINQETMPLVQDIEI